MSRYITRLRESKNKDGQTGRDGIDWPTTVGTWQQNESINRLETFANNLDVSQATEDTDLLNSVPTPWARLLLFESALYRDEHPSHPDVEDQWRGLLGVLALAVPLLLKVRTEPIKLSKYADEHAGQIAKTFIDLKPDPPELTGNKDGDKWNNFQLISVDDTVIGTTSPRTLVFTGVAHRCPSSIPFRSEQGRLSDPVAYYKKFNDTFYLGLLAYWLNGFIVALRQNAPLNAWMGTPPVAPGGNQISRLDALLERLRRWQLTLQGVQPATINATPASPFMLYPYTVITGLPSVQQPGQSDLFARGRKELMICYRPDHGSKLVNAFDQEVVNESLRVYDGRWIQANQPLPLPLTFVPETVKRIEDPSTFFEDRLIQVQLSDNRSAVYDLSVGDEQISQMNYLYPFKSEILDYFSADEIANNARIIPNPQTNSLRVELEIPLENNRKIKVAREYAIDAGVIAVEDKTSTAELAAWPDFSCPMWTRYFYFKTISAGAGFRPIDFSPLTDSVSRTESGHTWYATREPVRAFKGSIDGNTGLLLLKENRIDPPSLFWQVGVDFGSTHTRAFSLQASRLGEEKSGYKYVPSHGADIEPIEFVVRAQQLTYGDKKSLKEVFFALVGQVDPPVMSELKTLMMMPQPNPGSLNDWLPREGYTYSHWIYDGGYDPNGLHFNLKWNSNTDDHDLRAFLRCLLMMIQAEAIAKGARVVSVEHTYPSVFTQGLAAKHQNEWLDLQSYLNLGVKDSDSRVTIERSSITETVAVCRHLESEQEASPVTNTISLDVGGSTTDVAVWAEKRLEVQESIKLAAGIIGRYVQSSDALEFLKWYESVLQSTPYKFKVSLADFASKPSGYSLMFTNLLSALELTGHLKGLIDQINGEPKARRLMSYVIYLFGSLLYYAGLLARKAELPKKNDKYNIYFCGRGGTVVEWIRGYGVLAQEMFEAGLFGPAGRQGKVSPTVSVKLSAQPKQEVGRGLLVKNVLQGNARKDQVGLIDTSQPSVTVGETGYRNLKWDSELTAQALRSLPENTVPAMTDLKELATFLDVFKQARSTKAAALELGLDQVTPRAFQERLLQRLFGNADGCIVSDVRRDSENALLEPLFITEIKVLLETATPNIKMFP
jgi:hypothetical protein